MASAATVSGRRQRSWLVGDCPVSDVVMFPSGLQLILHLPLGGAAWITQGAVDLATHPLVLSGAVLAVAGFQRLPGACC